MNTALQAGKDYIGIAIVFFCHDGNGRVLMAKRSEQCRDEHGRWDIGAGALDVHETVLGTLHKEIEEEYCTKVLGQQFLGSRDVHRTHEYGYPTHWVTLDFLVHVDAAHVRNGEPHKLDEVEWFDWSALPQPQHSQLPVFFTQYKNQIEASLFHVEQ